MEQRILIRAPKLIATIDHDPIGNVVLVSIHDTIVRKVPFCEPVHDTAVELLDVDPFGPCRIEADRLVLSTFAAYALFEQCCHSTATDDQNIKRYMRQFADVPRAMLAAVAGMNVVDGREPLTAVVAAAIRSMALCEVGDLYALGAARRQAQSVQLTVPSRVNL